MHANPLNLNGFFVIIVYMMTSKYTLEDMLTNTQNADYNKVYDFLRFEVERLDYTRIDNIMFEITGALVDNYGADAAIKILKSFMYKDYYHNRYYQVDDNNRHRDIQLRRLLTNQSSRDKFLDGFDKFTEDTDGVFEPFFDEYVRSYRDVNNLLTFDNNQIDRLVACESWMVLYSARALRTLKVSTLGITRDKLIDLIIGLHDKGEDDLMMTFGDCLQQHADCKIQIGRSTLNLKWWLSMKDYPREFIEQAVAGTTANIDKEGYLSTAVDIVSKFKSFGNYGSAFYMKKLLRMNTNSSREELASSCSNAWIRKQLPTLKTISDNADEFLQNAPNLQNINWVSETDKILQPKNITTDYFRPYVAGNVSTETTMSYYAVAFKDRKTARHFAAWCWLVLSEIVLHPNLQHQFATAKGDRMPDELDDTAFNAYIKNGVVPDSYYHDYEITPVIKELMQTAVDDDNANLRASMQKILDKAETSLIDRAIFSEYL